MIFKWGEFAWKEVNDLIGHLQVFGIVHFDNELLGSADDVDVSGDSAAVVQFTGKWIVLLEDRMTSLAVVRDWDSELFNSLWARFIYSSWVNGIAYGILWHFWWAKSWNKATPDQPSEAKPSTEHKRKTQKVQWNKWVSSSC